MNLFSLSKYIREDKFNDLDKLSIKDESVV